MKIFKLLSLIGLIALLCNSCLKDPNENNNEPLPVSTFAEMQVPQDFRWETNQYVELNIQVPASKKYDPKSCITVFDGDPLSGGKRIMSGSAMQSEPLTGTMNLPAYLKSVFVMYENPFGGSTTVEVPIAGGKANYDFELANAWGTGMQKEAVKNFLSGPDCSSGCDEYISGNQNVTIESGKTYCVQDNFNGNIDFAAWNGGGTIRICGSATFTNNTIGMYSECHIVVAEGGSLTLNTLEMGNNSTLTVFPDAEVTINKLNCWSEMSGIVNYGTLEINNNSYLRAEFDNYGLIKFSNKLEIDRTSVVNTGELNIEGDFQVYGTGCSFSNSGQIAVGEKFQLDHNVVFINDGEIHVSEKLAVNDQAGLINNGSMVVEDDIDLNGSTETINNCKIVCDKEMSVTSSAKLILNSGYIKVTEDLNCWTNKDIELSGGSMISAQKLETDCNVLGSGDLSSIVIYDEVSLWNNSKINGNIELAVEGGSLNYGGASNFINGATYTSIENASNFLPITSCNPDGFGEPTIVDTDNDGIPDEMDAYPQDPERAFNHFIPGEGGQVTIAFEDLWPAQGDYDFNDFVVAVFGKEVANADNQIVDVYLNFVVKAVGASLNNGFGFSLENITPEMVDNVSGMVLERGYVTLNPNGTEAGQSKAVVIVSESVEDVITRSEGSMFNTIPENPGGTSDTTEIVIHFTDPLNPELFGPEGYNPFIIRDQNRDTEIHLAYFPPTDLMNTDLLGTGQDVSNVSTGVYFVTEANLPWGLMIMEPFDYPIEKADITQSYLFFSSWAESGGSIYPDWYKDYSGYRVDGNIFNQQ
ncbi:MAG: LruC domain-containing protein [Bacteroidales bacterium]|nr:LruC domain-containing protein [Bacteroidales bacterium]